MLATLRTGIHFRSQQICNTRARRLEKSQITRPAKPDHVVAEHTARITPVCCTVTQTPRTMALSQKTKTRINPAYAHRRQPSSHAHTALLPQSSSTVVQWKRNIRYNLLHPLNHIPREPYAVRCKRLNDKADDKLKKKQLPNVDKAPTRKDQRPQCMRRQVSTR